MFAKEIILEEQLAARCRFQCSVETENCWLALVMGNAENPGTDGTGRAFSCDLLARRKIVFMSPDVSELLKKALALPPEARAALAGSLLESLDDEPCDEGVEAAWNEEIKRRIEEIDSGKVQMIPYEEVRRRLAALLSDASK
jgi:putative addiction module component (TIGR02574 family)